MIELARLALRAVTGHRLRSLLSILGIAIGIGSVILLTSVGEGTRRYIVGQFSQFGTNLIAITPGKAETVGLPGVLGGTTRKLTIDDGQALLRVPGVEHAAPRAFGMGRVEAEGRGRSVFVYGVTPEIEQVWQWGVRVGSFWSSTDPRRGSQEAVLGAKLKREIFGAENVLGRFVRIGGTRYRVVGIMEPKGQMLGFDLDDAAFVPVASAMRTFNLDELNEIDLVFRSGASADTVVEGITALLTERHSGKEDFTITTQAAMLEVFGNIMDIITLAVGAIAGVSLVVGAIGVLTMMWIAVGERTSEIGLVRSIGATRRQVQLVFLSEAAVLAGLGGALGLTGGLGICALMRAAIPGLPVHTPPVFMVLALLVSLGTGLVSGVLPARRAASFDPVQALRAE